MPPATPCLFHQNMQVFGGGNPDRNAAFGDMVYLASQQVFDELGARTIVAGFTEVRNNQSAKTALQEIAKRIVGNSATVYEYHCGMTAGKTEEYIVIATRRGVTVEHTGRGVRTSDGWVLVPDSQHPIGQPPGISSLDFRALCYMRIRFEGKSMVVGFMHNMYTLKDERSSSRFGLEDLARKISAQDPVPIVLGGDFNLPPYTVRSPRSLLSTICQLDAAGEPVLTTAKNAYDYWFQTTPNPIDDALVLPMMRLVPHASTGKPVSDHAGVAASLGTWA